MGEAPPPGFWRTASPEGPRSPPASSLAVPSAAHRDAGTPPTGGAAPGSTTAPPTALRRGLSVAPDAPAPLALRPRHRHGHGRDRRRAGPVLRPDVDLGLIGTSLTAEGCDGRDPARQLRSSCPSRRRSTTGTATRRRRDHRGADRRHQPRRRRRAGVGDAAAGEPRRGHRPATSTSDPLASVDGGRATGGGRGLARTPDARPVRPSELETSIWPAPSRSRACGGTPATAPGAERRSRRVVQHRRLDVLGVEIPFESLDAGDSAINAALAPIGFPVELPHVERLDRSRRPHAGHAVRARHRRQPARRAGRSACARAHPRRRGEHLFDTIYEAYCTAGGAPAARRDRCRRRVRDGRSGHQPRRRRGPLERGRLRGSVRPRRRAAARCAVRRRRPADRRPAGVRTGRGGAACPPAAPRRRPRRRTRAGRHRDAVRVDAPVGLDGVLAGLRQPPWGSSAPLRPRPSPSSTCVAAAAAGRRWRRRDPRPRFAARRGRPLLRGHPRRRSRLPRHGGVGRPGQSPRADDRGDARRRTGRRVRTQAKWQPSTPSRAPPSSAPVRCAPRPAPGARPGTTARCTDRGGRRGAPTAPCRCRVTRTRRRASRSAATTAARRHRGVTADEIVVAVRELEGPDRRRAVRRPVGPAGHLLTRGGA